MSLLGGILSGILGGGGTPTSSTQNAGILPTLPGLSLPGISIPGLPTLSLPTGSTPPASVTVSASSVSPVSSSAPPSSSAPTSSAPAEPTPPVAPTTPLPDQSSAASGGTQTDVVFVTPSPSQTGDTSSAQQQNSFLQNKALSGTVFGLVGLVVLVLIFAVATFFVRRRRRSRLLDDAMSFDPGLLAAADRSEKGHASHASLSSSPGSGRGYGTTSGTEYYGQQAYQQPGEYYGAQPAIYGYAPPMATENTQSWGQQPQQQTAAPAAEVRPVGHNMHQVAVPPVAGPLPDEFGSSDSADARRQSAEEVEFWARTLKVANE